MPKPTMNSLVKKRARLDLKLAPAPPLGPLDSKLSFRGMLVMELFLSVRTYGSVAERV